MSESPIGLSCFAGVLVTVAACGVIAIAQDVPHPGSQPTSQPTSQPSTQPSRQFPAPMPEGLPRRGDVVSPGEQFANRIDAAHGGDRWDAAGAIQSEFVLSFGGEERFRGTMTWDIDGNRVRLEQDSGEIMVFDGHRAYSTADDVTGTRFNLLTWPYFLGAPFKLNDPGTTMSVTGPRTLEGKPQASGRLTFGDDIGDSPDDWYVIYADPQTHQLNALAYIVTYTPGGPVPVEQAERDPHAIVYHDYEDVDGANISTRWKFYNWSIDKGVHGDVIGEANLEDVQFIAVDDDMFEPPHGAKVDRGGLESDDTEE